MPPESSPHQPPPYVPHKAQGKSPSHRVILAVEAAIATLVLSLFVSSSPRLFATQPQSARPATAINPDHRHMPHNHAPTAPATQTAGRTIQRWGQLMHIQPQSHRP